VVDGARLRLTSSDPAELTVGVFPCPDADALDRGGATVSTDGVFCRFTAAAPPNRSATVVAEQLKPAGPPRTIPLGNIDRPVPEAPNDADFAEAAVWRINLPDDLELPERPLLRVHYAGDVARVTLDGKLLVDDFYNGRPLEIGLWRYAPHAFKGDLQIAILPLREDALIYLAKKARPARNGATSAAEIQRAEIVPTYTVTLAPNASSDSPD
jgi:hypothetical protein